MTRPRDRRRALHARLAFLELRLNGPHISDGHRDFLSHEQEALEWALRELAIYDEEELRDQKDKQRGREAKRDAREENVVRMRVLRVSRPIEGDGAA